MKFFVTDAQLAVWRLEIEVPIRTDYNRSVEHIATAAAQVREKWESERDMLATLHESEITRLRADRDAELARLADPAQPFVTHLREEVAFWRQQVVHERQRAEVAIDQCRATHLGIGPVSLPPRDERPPSALAFGPGAEQELAMMGRTDL